MKTLLTGCATAALGVAVILTLLLAVASEMFTYRTPSGPDSMGLFFVFLLPVFAWLLVLAAALAAVAQGRFDWVSRWKGVPSLAVLVTVIGLGILSFAAVVYSFEIRFAFRTVAGIAGGFLLPLLVAAFLALLLWTEPDAPAAARLTRPAASILAVLALVAFAGVGIYLARDAAESARRAEAQRAEEEAEAAKTRAENAARVERQNAELDALPDDAPLETFFSHLYTDATEEHQKRAVARICALPDLPERLAVRLSVPQPLQREYALYFVRMAAKIDPAWEPAVRKAIVLLAADYRAEATDRSAGRITHVRGLAWGALLTAQRFGPKRFETEVKELRAALAAWPEGEERNEALRLLDLYLAGETVPA